MKYPFCQGLVIGVVALVAMCWATLAPHRAVGNDPPRETVGSSRSDFVVQGVASCSAAACHHAGGPVGRDGPVGGKLSEYTTWINHDKHARAYRVLFDERSRRIMRNLYGSQAPLAEKTTLCLSCHATDVPEDQRSPYFAIADGVGCESCHGPAEKWRAVHYLPSWKALRSEEKQALGMWDTKDLTMRAEACARCHVGAGDSDVNHDLIAAGHPRMDFEFSAFLTKMPRHWDERADRERYPDFEARAWAVGQIVAAQAALRLLAHRADGAAEGKKPWPEFAEYDCSACHHDLTEPSWRQTKEHLGKRRPGAIPWGSWYFALTDRVSTDFGPADNQKSPFGALAELMGKPNPEPREASARARVLSRALDKWRVTLRGRSYEPVLDARQVQDMLNAVARTRESRALDWDSAAQRGFALAALYRGLVDLDPQRRDAELMRLTTGLRGFFWCGRDCDSPIRLDANAKVWEETLRAVETRLGRPGW